MYRLIFMSDSSPSRWGRGAKSSSQLQPELQKHGNDHPLSKRRSRLWFRWLEVHLITRKVGQTVLVRIRLGGSPTHPATTINAFSLHMGSPFPPTPGSLLHLRPLSLPILA